ncbi:MAG: molybdate ABC transporter permease subunit [Candidatus Dormibacteraeota bacterium]|uniref:Molybdenum transport system permease n=1 Tax=Candidatus Amunia macphersoniae TaxID=3127014 RepID=A0A934KL29_9BACT|nr:molybdate ABC transporter permease subunit [Candidatus Dormibacteraeota bacterium]
MTGRRPPLLLLIPAAGALALILVPLAGLLGHVPWTTLLTQITSNQVGSALLLSLECSLLAVAVALVLGVPLAWTLARTSFPGKALVRALVTLPMVLPPVVGGVALLLAFGAHGFAGQALAHLGITLPFTTAGAVVAETFVAMPFLIIAVEAGLRQADERYEEAAATLGAAPWMRFWRVTLPLIAPSLAAGAALTWARALGEFGATITFAGNLPGTTQTMPLAVYVALESDTDGAIALSLVLLVVSLGVLIGLRHRWLGATG